MFMHRERDDAASIDIIFDAHTALSHAKFRHAVPSTGKLPI